MAIECNNGVYSFVDSEGKTRRSRNVAHIEYLIKKEAKQQNTSVPVSMTEVETTQEFSINERFEFLENYVAMVSDKLQPALLVTGLSGLGKSYTVNKTLQESGFTDVSNTEEESEYVEKSYKTIKGYSTPKALYRLLFENKDSILIIDDADSAILDPVAVNLIKAVVDSTAERFVSWNAEMREDDLPRSFKFTGGIIFITNLPKSKIPQAIRTRSVIVDVTMTQAEKIERMKHIAFSETFMPDSSTTAKTLAFEIIDTVVNDVKELSLRTLIQTVRIFSTFNGEKAKKLAKYALCG